MAPEQNISFTKMQGTGNDFVVLDNRSDQLSKEEIISLAPHICNRKYGVGADGILALFAPQQSNVDYTMFYRNPDGSDAGMCGNGARCIALFAHSLGFDAEHRFNVHENVYKAELTNSESVTIAFPMKATITELTIDNRKLYSINTGTEHVVTEVDNDLLNNHEYLFNEGRRLRYHDAFSPAGTNVNFICGLDKSSLELQTYERGVEDLTLACGTGAIASALVWHHRQSTESPHKYRVQTEGGTLTVYFSFDSKSNTYNDIKLQGPAHFVFKGTYLQ